MTWYDASVKPPRSGEYCVLTAGDWFTSLSYSEKYGLWNVFDHFSEDALKPIKISAWAFLPDKDMINATKEMSR